MNRAIVGSLAFAALAFGALAQAEQVGPGVLRTPDARFEGLEDWPYAPHYRQVGGIRLHYVDAGPALAKLMVDFMQGRDLPAAINADGSIPEG